MENRIDKLKAHVQSLHQAPVRRTTLFPLVAESLAQTEGQYPAPIRRAMAFAHLMDNVDLVVLPHELIVGSVLGMWPVVEDLPPYEARRAEMIQVIEDAIERGVAAPEQAVHGKVRRWALTYRLHIDANIPFDQFQRLRQDMEAHFADDDRITAQQIGLLVEEHCKFDYGDETKRLFAELPWIAANHLDFNFPKALQRGLGDIRREIEGRLVAETDPDRQVFYQSTGIAMDAAIRFIQRYAATMRQQSNEMVLHDALRAQELREMAAVCERIATEPPTTFGEALQLMWMVHTLANMGGGVSLSLGRFDQYLRSFYEDDLATGRLTRQQAKELVGSVWAKVNEPKRRTVESVCLAGVTPQGEDGTSDLTRLCLEICGQLKMPFPNVSVRFSHKSPAWLMDQVVETIKMGFGHPMVLNDEMWIPNLVRQGFDIRDAREYYNMGCTEIMLQGMMPQWGGSGGIDFPGLIELVFRNGQPNLRGVRGIPTGSLDELDTFEKFLDAFIAQAKARVNQLRRGREKREAATVGVFYDPFASTMVEGCLERGKDLYQGGSKLGASFAIGGYGLGTGIDSLAAIKRLVYDEGRFSLSELFGILQRNFQGHEPERTLMDRQTPCFGNDIAETDAIAAIVFNAWADEVHRQNEISDVRGVFSTQLFSYTRHVNAAELIAATPNGRYRGAPMSDAMSPSQGKDVNGPTSMLKSVMKIDHHKITGAYALNLKLSATVASGASGSQALKALIQTYFDGGGGQLQVNLVDPAVLVDAQDNPEQYKDLVVRVAGFSEYFVCLDKSLQDEIIRRTAHQV